MLSRYVRMDSTVRTNTVVCVHELCTIQPAAKPPADIRFEWDLGNVNSMPVKKLMAPAFSDGKEEAAWWQKHRADVEAGLRAVMRTGKTLSLKQVLAQAQRKKELQTVIIRLASEDIATARHLADDKGIGYQTYIKVLLHEALCKEARRLAKR